MLRKVDCYDKADCYDKTQVSIVKLTTVSSCCFGDALSKTVVTVKYFRYKGV